ncbi:unnamed protein product [Brachionus calyciflorus]|uniref:MULE transposase domain-containing protein n=1 Tax=Brachionus calyciflorus TaxID=104777 RepID=A0A813QFG4_9BILA|nr:unnamed protein product [Brachionus calyciflorus]
MSKKEKYIIVNESPMRLRKKIIPKKHFTKNVVSTVEELVVSISEEPVVSIVEEPVVSIVEEPVVSIIEESFVSTVENFKNLTIYDDDKEYNPEEFYEEIGCNLANAEESNEEDSEPNGLTIVKTKFGKPKLCYEGHYYTIDKVRGTKFFEPVVITNGHNHLPDPSRTECLLAIDKLKSLAQLTNQNLRAIIKSEQIDLTNKSSAKMTRHTNLTQMVKRVQSKKVDSGDVTKTREQINIPDCLMNTYSGERFLLDDSGSDDEERVLIFGTKNNIDLLETNPEWYCDGTFAVSPSLFYQVFTINKAIWNAIVNVFPGTQIVGCYFHLVQNLWKQVQGNSLTKRYCSDGNIRKAFRCLQSLVFVPKKDVVYSFMELKKNCPNGILSVYNYFEKNYIGCLKTNSVSVRKVPLFPIHIWNMSDRVVNDLPRTNNSLESWHKQFELDTKKHQSVFKLIEQFRLEQQNTDVLSSQLTSGDFYKRKKKEANRDEAIKKLVKEFKRECLMNWFDKFILLL